MSSDINVLVASTGMLHSPANFRAMAAGIPAICMDGGMTLEMFQSGAVTDDMKQITVRKHFVAENVFGVGARECRVTSRFGTDFTYRVDQRIFVPPLPTGAFDPYKIVNFDKDENRKGGNLYYYLFPSGEFNVAPIEGSANGQLVIDLTMHHLGRLTSPIVLTVKDGRVVTIEGGRRRTNSSRLSVRSRRPQRVSLSSGGIGWRQRQGAGARHPAGRQEHSRHDAFRSGHQHRRRRIDVSKIHMDGVILEPTLYVDTVKKIEHGRILVPIEG